ncbi:MAG: DUF2807 domain-containing protein [Anaerolineae bacterium]|nr:DUF2807 domain-containing protein [Anaerolineae bacterium]
MLRSRTAMLLCGLVIAVLAASGCNPIISNNANVTVGSEKYIEETRDVSGFTGVKLEGSGVVVIEKGDTEGVAIETDDNIMPLIVTEVNGGVLRLGFKDNVSISTKRLMFTITAHDVTSFEILGSGAIAMASLDAESVSVVIGGSGTVSLLGDAARQDIRIDGNGAFEGSNLGGQEATVTIGGSGTAFVNVSDRLDVKISGSGAVSYSSDPRVTQEITGSGTVVKR